MREKIIAIVLAGCMMCFGALALTACGGSSDGSSSGSSAPAEQTKPADTDITLSEFEAIEDGMSYDQVVEVVGCEGTEQSSSNVEAGGQSLKTVIYAWEGNGAPGSNANVTFQNDKVVGKAQIGLE